MKEIIINVPDDAVEFVEEFVERIGGNVEIGKTNKKSNNKKSSNKKKTSKLKPLDFFGTWPDIPLDPQTYRKDVWRRIPEL